MTSYSSRSRVLGVIQDSIRETAPSGETRSDIENKVLEARALISRLLEMPQDIRSTLYSGDILIKWNGSVVDKHLASFIDPDLVVELRYEYSPEYIEKDEYNEIIERLQELLKIDEVRKEYGELADDIESSYLKLLKLTHAYETWELTIKDPLVSGQKREKTTVKLDESNKNAVARQIIRILDSFQGLIKQEIQNIHNQVSSGGRDYKTSDEKAIGGLDKKLEQCTALMNRLVATNHEVAIQIRMDELKNDSAILRRSKKIKRSKIARIAGEAYVEVPTRQKTIYGDHSGDNYILAALRNGQNVELLGPTGTGKTKLAVHAATVFAGKPPIVISGGPWVYRSTFYGSAKDLGKRNLWAVIQCIVEDRILIIDEDNRIDPRQMAEIKYILGLKPGDIFTHPDTGERFEIPRHFAVMVTRNEKDKHHSDRYDLPPEYRREFTHGSFEIDYYTPDELYDNFLLPKLLNDDGSIGLSPEEIGWDIKKNQLSPLLALTLAAKEIQEQYKQTKLKAAVFESGYLIDILNQWKEIRFKKGKDGNTVSFLHFLETKLIEFIKRPIWNQDRKIIATILINHGFYRWWKREDFSTVKDGEIFTDAEFAAMGTTIKTLVFKKPSSRTLSSREAALLDPFHKREIKIPPHPLEAEINEFVSWFQEFSEANAMKPMVIIPHTFEAKKKDIVAVIKKKIDEEHMRNGEVMKAVLDKMTWEKTVDFLVKFREFTNKLGATSIISSVAEKIKNTTSGQVTKILSPFGNWVKTTTVPSPDTIQKVAAFAEWVRAEGTIGFAFDSLISQARNLDVRIRDSRGDDDCTFLMAAAQEWNKDIFKLLLDNDADLSLVDRVGYNVLDIVVDKQKQEFIDIMRAHLTNVEPQDPNFEFKKKMLRELYIKLDDYGKWVDPFNYSPAVKTIQTLRDVLEFLKWIWDQELSRALLDTRDLNSLGESGYTAIMYAFSERDKTIFKLLLDNNVNIAQKNNDRRDVTDMVHDSSDPAFKEILRTHLRACSKWEPNFEIKRHMLEKLDA